jgi:hypothetical protein
VSSIRFFTVVSPVPRYLQLALLASVVLGTWMLWLNPRDIDSALGSVLFLQMCAVSNGYVSAARRGWFDPLIVSGRNRRRTAYANLAAAALPGAVAWLALAVMQAVLLAPAWPSSLSANRLAALAIVTTVGWAAGLHLPRAGSALVWSAILVITAMSRRWLPSLASLQLIPSGLGQVGADVGACLVCPFLLLGDSAAVRDPRVVAGVILAAAVCAVAGAISLDHRESPLVIAP